MKEAGYGRIINITSSAGLRGNFGQTNYGAAKAGLMGMTFVWALELGRSGITVNALAPAGATRMTAGLAGDGAEARPPPRPGPQRTAGGLPGLGARRPRQRADLRPHRLRFTLFQHPKQIAWMHQEGGWGPEIVRPSSTACSASTCRPSAW